MLDFLDEVCLDSLLDTLKLIPFLYITYLFMEWLEHSSSKKMERFLYKTGKIGPLFGALVGGIPQCGFSAAAANLYTARVISLGTLIAVFLSTSDEMIPILLANVGSVPVASIFLLVGIKIVVGIAVGFAVSGAGALLGKKREEIDIDEICEREGCHCGKNIFLSALHHTLTISLFIFIVNLVIGSAVFFFGTDFLKNLLYDRPVISHLLAALVGIIPNCASSSALTTFYVEGFITSGTLLAGLLPGAGVGYLVLLRINRHPKENFLILGTTVLVGVVFGLLFDLLGLGAIL